jgi:co-chaperonin GroES (HSP10)
LTQTSGDSAATADTITDFTSADDVIVLEAADNVAGLSGTLGTAAGTNVQVTAGGLVTFATADDTLAEKLIAVAADDTDVANREVVFFVDGGNTYIYGAGTGTAVEADDYLIVLEGVTGLTTLTEDLLTAGDFSLT